MCYNLYMFDFNNFDFEKEIKKIKKLKGYERGADLIFLIKYIKQKQGEKEYQRLNGFLSDYGVNLPSLEKINKMEWISVSLTTSLMLGVLELFNWEKEDIIQMGKAAVSLNFTVKFFVKYFFSVEKTLRQAAQNWNKYFTFGTIEIIDYNKQAKSIKIRLKNFNRHKIICFYFLGLFSQVIKIATGKERIIGEEVECFFEGGLYHEYFFKW